MTKRLISEVWKINEPTRNGPDPWYAHLCRIAQRIRRRFESPSKDLLLFYAIWQLHFTGPSGDFPPALLRAILAFVFASKENASRYSGGCKCLIKCDCTKEFLGFFVRGAVFSYLERIPLDTTDLADRIFRLHFMYKRGFYDWHFFEGARKCLASKEELRSHGLATFLSPDGQIFRADFSDEETFWAPDISRPYAGIAFALSNYSDAPALASFSEILTKINFFRLPVVYGRPVFTYIFAHLHREQYGLGKHILRLCVLQQYPISELKLLYTSFRMETRDIFKVVSEKLSNSSHESFQPICIPMPNNPCCLRQPWYVKSIIESFGLLHGWWLLRSQSFFEHIVYEDNHMTLRYLLGYTYQGWVFHNSRYDRTKNNKRHAKVFERLLATLCCHYKGMTYVDCRKLIHWIPQEQMPLSDWVLKEPFAEVHWKFS
jgi:hypothetical protein